MAGFGTEHSNAKDKERELMNILGLGSSPEKITSHSDVSSVEGTGIGSGWDDVVAAPSSKNAVRNERCVKTLSPPRDGRGGSSSGSNRRSSSAAAGGGGVSVTSGKNRKKGGSARHVSPLGQQERQPKGHRSNVDSNRHNEDSKSPKERWAWSAFQSSPDPNSLPMPPMMMSGIATAHQPMQSTTAATSVTMGENRGAEKSHVRDEGLSELAPNDISNKPVLPSNEDELKNFLNLS